MKDLTFVKLALCLVVSMSFGSAVFAQEGGLLKRSTFKTDRLDFGVGGTLAVIGAPNGSIRVEGWANNEIEIAAEIEIQAATEQDLETLSKVTGFVLEESLGRTGVISVGTHDKKYMKRSAKKFPKHLLAMPFRIDYVIKVPRYCDLQIDGGRGDLFISGVEGSMRINYLDSNARIDLVGGSLNATFGKGNVEITVPTRSWRGRMADVQLAAGEMSISLPPRLDAEIDANILRTGRIESAFTEWKPRVRKAEFTDKSIIAKAGIGGIPMKFTVGDGTMRILSQTQRQ